MYQEDIVNNFMLINLKTGEMDKFLEKKYNAIPIKTSKYISL